MPSIAAGRVLKGEMRQLGGLERPELAPAGLKGQGLKELKER